MIAAAWKKNDSLKHKSHVYSGKKDWKLPCFGLSGSEYFSFRIHGLISKCENTKKKRMNRSCVFQAFKPCRRITKPSPLHLSMNCDIC